VNLKENEPNAHISYTLKGDKLGNVMQVFLAQLRGLLGVRELGIENYSSILVRIFYIEFIIPINNNNNYPFPTVSFFIQSLFFRNHRVFLMSNDKYFLIILMI